MLPNLTLTGLTVQSYHAYTLYLKHLGWADVPGNYAFAHLDTQGIWIKGNPARLPSLALPNQRVVERDLLPSTCATPRTAGRP